MPTHDCKTFPNETSARNALNAAAWTPPAYTNIGGGRHVPHASLPAQKLSEPVELTSGRWAVIADHPGFRGESVDPDKDFKRASQVPAGAQQAQAKGAER